MNENFSENLKKARQDARMTQAEVAKIVGVAKNTYCNWEQGTREPSGVGRIIPDAKNHAKRKIVVDILRNAWYIIYRNKQEHTRRT